MCNSCSDPLTPLSTQNNRAPAWRWRRTLLSRGLGCFQLKPERGWITSSWPCSFNPIYFQLHSSLLQGIFVIIAFRVEVIQMLDTSLQNHLAYTRNWFNNVFTDIICNTALAFLLIMESDLSFDFIRNESVGRPFAHSRTYFLQSLKFIQTKLTSFTWVYPQRSLKTPHYLRLWLWRLSDASFFTFPCWSTDITHNSQLLLWRFCL